MYDLALDFDAGAMMSDAELAEYNKTLSDWSKKAKSTLQSGITQEGIGGTELAKSIKPRLYKAKNKDISGIGFSFRREGIYVHKGAGRGMGGQKGSSWLDKYGVRKKTNPESLGKLATGNRVAKPWFDALDNDLQELSDIVAENYAGRAVNTTQLFNKQ